MRVHFFSCAGAATEQIAGRNLLWYKRDRMFEQGATCSGNLTPFPSCFLPWPVRASIMTSTPSRLPSINGPYDTRRMNQESVAAIARLANFAKKRMNLPGLSDGQRRVMPVTDDGHATISVRPQTRDGMSKQTLGA
ncbi:predicted protein [Plenodomus lingam JN3]|uniref:Predicted protein n=1 Tax=Leptosphaeria maculans (strain JN3 / isolate v23.1.3 / race Av1-4-5-6-7-8) TaxID=985895 RepID=E4ZMI3_LEPMJ|nr:predicted protein [Plenodomus lingam JN3]CBX92852.1 predicted protein [Plenodomus lingam JN3]